MTPACVDIPALTRGERRLMVALEARIIERRALADAMCGQRDESALNTLRIVVNRLRRKGVDIATIYGVGYTLGQRKRCEACGGSGLQ